MSEAIQIIDDISGDSPQVDRSTKLDTVQSVRREMVNLYYKAKRSCGDDIGLPEAGKLTYLLDRIRSCISESDLESRISALENKLEGRQ